MHLGYVIIPMPYVSSRCRRFDLLAQSVAAMTAVVGVATGGWRSTMTAVFAAQIVAVPASCWRSTVTAYHHRWFIQLNTGVATWFLRVFGCFSPKNFC